MFSWRLLFPFHLPTPFLSFPPLTYLPTCLPIPFLLRLSPFPFSLSHLLVLPSLTIIILLYPFSHCFLSIPSPQSILSLANPSSPLPFPLTQPPPFSFSLLLFPTLPSPPPVTDRIMDSRFNSGEKKNHKHIHNNTLRQSAKIPLLYIHGHAGYCSYYT